MSEIKFGADQVAATEVAATPATPTPAQQLPAVSAPRALTQASGPALGDFIPSFSDIILPNINIAQAVGALGESFDQGTLILNQNEALYVPPRLDPKTKAVLEPGSPPVILTVLGWKQNRFGKNTRFVEKVSGGARGMIVDTEAEVVAAGGTTDWGEWNLKKASGMKKFDVMSTALVCIQRPEVFPDNDTIFTFEVDGLKYAVAWWNMKGSCYTEAARRVFFTARQTGCLRKGGYPSWSYAVTTYLKPYEGGKQAWVPQCIPNKQSSQSFLDFAKGILNPDSIPQQAPDAGAE